MDHSHDIKRAVQHIENHLSHGLTARTISQQVPLSEFYFYRLFKQHIGLSVMGYCQRRKLSEGALRWAMSQKKLKLVDIAFQMGFSGHSSFTRSFKQYFGMTPSDYYKAYCQKVYELYPPHNFWVEDIVDEAAIYDMTYKQVDLGDLKVLGIQMSSTLAQKQNFEDVDHIIMEMRQALLDKGHEKMIGNQEVGIAFNAKMNPYNQGEVTFDYFRGLLIERIDDIPQHFRVFKIPAQSYLQFTTTSDEVVYQDTVNYIYGHVMVNEGIKIEDKQTNLIEFFHHDRVLEGGYIEVTLYVPIEDSKKP